MSSSHLCPCPACNRHVMTDAGTCPFCQTALPATFCTAAPPEARGRMSRAAMVLAGATMVGVSACSSGTPRVIAPYGISPPFDAAAPNQDADSGTGGDGATDTDSAPSNDAGADHSDGGTSDGGTSG